MDTRGPLGPPPLEGTEDAPVSQSVPVRYTPQLITSTQSSKLPEEDEEIDPLNEHVVDPGDPDGVVAAELEEVGQVPLKESDSAEPRSPKKRRWPLVIGIVLLIALLGGAAYYWFAVRNNNSSQSTSSAPADTHTSTTPEVPSQPANVPTKHYDSTTFSLSFDYPETWKVAETTDKLTVTSPASQLPAVDGTTKSGQVVVVVQNKQTTIPNYPTAGALAALTSDKLTYTHPSSIQRAQTYLSYLSYHTATTLDTMYITGDHGYQEGQQIPMSDLVQSDPLISVGFTSCTSATSCANGQAMSLLASAWHSSPLATNVVNLLQSIVLN